MRRPELWWALGLTACAAPLPPAMPSEPVGTQFTANQGWVVRALAAPGGACARLDWPGGSAAMAQRSAPGEVRAASFDTASCEAAWPFGVAALSVGNSGRSLTAPVAEPQHIVLVADTVCRMKQADKAFQDCNDPVAWPFARVARAAAALKPDLIVHIGDIHCRESPCPADQPDCAGSIWGYGEDAWRADFFTLAAPLLATAPWVFVCGNQEVCKRTAVGWVRYLDAFALTPERCCDDPARDDEDNFSPPYAVPLSADTQPIVFDSAAAVDKPYWSDDPVFQR